MAIAFHEMQFFPHAVLLVETSKGTWVLDNLYETVLCWDAVTYIFTHREQPDGQWARFLLP
jgi:predicted transglutaminase-like cysteine proteinase